MADDDHPVDRYLHSISKSMLLPVVRRILGSETVEIDDWRSQPLDEGSVVGSVIRLMGTGQDRTQKVTWSVILKFVLSPWGGEGKFVSLNDEPTSAWYWRRERLLYESGLFSDLPDGFAAPVCYLIDDQPDGYWLWLEDIEDPFHRRWPFEHYAIAAQHLGRFNGRYLAGHELPSWPWLTPPAQRLQEEENHRVDADVWPQLFELRRQHTILRRVWPDGLIENCYRIWQERRHFYQALEKLPKTLRHGDAGNRNLFLRTRNGQRETVAIDWSFAGFGAVGEDLMPLVLSSVLWFAVSPSQFAELDQLAFEGYLQGLRDIGWHGDPKAARLGYLALATLQFGYTTLARTKELLALPDAQKRKVESVVGRPFEDWVCNVAAVSQIVVTCADEARTLMDYA